MGIGPLAASAAALDGSASSPTSGSAASARSPRADGRTCARRLARHQATLPGREEYHPAQHSTRQRTSSHPSRGHCVRGARNNRCHVSGICCFEQIRTDDRLPRSGLASGRVRLGLEQGWLGPADLERMALEESEQVLVARQEVPGRKHKVRRNRRRPAALGHGQHDALHGQALADAHWPHFHALGALRAPAAVSAGLRAERADVLAGPYWCPMVTL